MTKQISIEISHSRRIVPLLLLLLLLSPIVAAQSTENGTNPPPPDSQLGFNTRINPSMAIIIVVLIAAFFFMGFFSIYIRQCAGDSNASVHQAGGLRGGRSRRGAPRGLDTAVIETFPILEYSAVKGLKLGKGALECAVCLNEFEDNETLRLLPKCSHVFHPDCIDAWLSSHTTCPVCRSNLVPGSEPESAAAAAEAPDQETATNVENRAEAETADHVVIEVPEEMGTSWRPEVVVPAKMPPTLQNRPVRSRSSRRPMRFPRSHSTGHSLVQPGENMERYTLRVPEHVRKEIMSGKLQRTTSWVGYSGGGEGSSRGGRSYRGGGEGSSRGGRSLRGGGGGEGSSRGRGFPFGRFEWAVKSDRWVLSVTPPFFSRTLSMKSPKVADGEITPGKKNPLASVKTPFECLGKPETDEEASARASTPVFTVSEK